MRNQMERGLKEDKLGFGEKTLVFVWSTMRMRFCLFPIFQMKNCFFFPK